MYKCIYIDVHIYIHMHTCYVQDICTNIYNRYSHACIYMHIP